MAESRADRVLQEIVEKVDSYESEMSDYMANIGNWADLWRIESPSKKRSAWSNPRSTEFFRACNAISTLMFRMMTSQEPFFKAMPTNPQDNFADLTAIESVIQQQLKAAEYKRYLLKGCNFVVPFGTVICQEDLRTVGVGSFGRRIPVTSFRPRPMDQVAFDRSALEIDDADWVATMDLVSPSQLKRLAADNSRLGTAWLPRSLEEEADRKENGNDMNHHVRSRLQRAGINGDEGYNKRRELIMYYGKLDTLNDGVEYVVGIINRRTLVRFHPNNFQHGSRPFRVAKWKDFDSPLGEGLGSLLGDRHRDLDSIEQKATDVLAMAAYNIWARKRGSVLDEDLVIRPNKVIDMDDVDDMRPLTPNVGAAESALLLMDRLQQSFRNTAGAPDTLQAIVTNATATESSLAQNEAIRNISVSAEQAAEQLVRKHLEACHANNVQFLKNAIDVHDGRQARRFYPADLRVDVDFELKTTTDKDFKPQRLTELQQLLQTLVSTKSAFPEQMDMSVKPIVKAIAHMLDVPPEEVISNPAAPGNIGQADLAGLAESTIPPAGPGGSTVIDTPVGPTLAS